jgi:hypothetical protein
VRSRHWAVPAAISATASAPMNVSHAAVWSGLLDKHGSHGQRQHSTNSSTRPGGALPAGGRRPFVSGRAQDVTPDSSIWDARSHLRRRDVADRLANVATCRLDSRGAEARGLPSSKDGDRFRGLAHTSPVIELATEGASAGADPGQLLGHVWNRPHRPARTSATTTSSHASTSWSRDSSCPEAVVGRTLREAA